MSAITLYPVATVLVLTAAEERPQSASTEMFAYSGVPVVTRKWVLQGGEDGRPRLVAIWASSS